MKLEAYDSMREYENKHFWYVARQEIVISLIKKYLSNKAVNILDYGCGSGYISEAVINLNQSLVVTSADHNEQALSHCRERSLPHVVDLRVEKLIPGSYDLILCLDVIEHIENDVEFMDNLRALLRPDGIMLVTVPAYEFLWSGEDYVSNHVRRYTLEGFKKKIKKTNLNIEKISYFNFLLFVPIVIHLILSRLLNPKSMYRTNVRPYGDFLNKLLTNIFRSEKIFLPFLNFPFGFSLLAVLRSTKPVRSTNS
jgi:2-polyprenyl-3-methyl-5-hydroxy-6-metoxy-1,4-benzoquinol methylase